LLTNSGIIRLEMFFGLPPDVRRWLCPADSKQTIPGYALVRACCFGFGQKSHQGQSPNLKGIVTAGQSRRRTSGGKAEAAACRAFRAKLMLLPMFGFLITLITIGGLASLVAAADPQHARLARFLGFPLLFAGVAALCLSMGLAWLVRLVLGSDDPSGLGLLAGYLIGLLGGAALGLRRARTYQSS
jgi:hypothetical protein